MHSAIVIIAPPPRMKAFSTEPEPSGGNNPRRGTLSRTRTGHAVPISRDRWYTRSTPLGEFPGPAPPLACRRGSTAPLLLSFISRGLPPMPRKQTARKKFNGKCFFCAETCYASLQAHRILPGSRDGKYTWTNTLTVCASCHCKIHAGVIEIDRRYQSTQGPVLHCWIDGQERWLLCP